MIKFLKYLFVTFALTSCLSPSDKIKDVILYQDSIGYWNYEWPRERADFYGFTFKFGKDGSISKYSFDKIEDRRTLFSDYGIEPRLKWGVANDSIFTIMNYNSQIKIMRYNKNTIWMYDKERKRSTMLIKVKGDLNIEK
ncbi:hypothetical protein SAMN05421841_4265 [Chryseobacterium wanjuense]|uniref:Lipocalin-like domain-containing protein n=1 Tax=Chryseobacterium wanjuense TaxID=356305 RepID=A0A1I0S6I1_9FLAO|nr:hypothetical protein [Chryseobacterium wanjuense]SEW49649.1 hypothetical protein SAMN05421841_4265 [Chryseobacterium wanjuense]